MNGSSQANAPGPASVLDRPLQILHLEDDPDDQHLIQTWLAQQNIAAEFTTVDSEAEFIQAFEKKTFDIILSDKNLAGFDGLAALRLVRDKFPHLPFVFVTGSMGEEAAIETMKRGATDYVLKDRLSRLIPAVQRAIREHEQEERNRRTEERNREQAILLDNARDAILVTDAEGKIVYWNKSAERLYGWSAEAVIGPRRHEHSSDRSHEILASQTGASGKGLLGGRIGGRQSRRSGVGGGKPVDAVAR